MVLEKMDQKHMDSISLGKIYGAKENQVVWVKCFKFYSISSSEISLFVN